MKVKFFGFQLSIKSKGLFGANPRIENAGEIEAVVNDWLASQPDIRIAHIQQTGTGGIGYQFLYVTVWYEESRKEG
jgi:hypothetical protein